MDDVPVTSMTWEQVVERRQAMARRFLPLNVLALALFLFGNVPASSMPIRLSALGVALALQVPGMLELRRAKAMVQEWVAANPDKVPATETADRPAMSKGFKRGLALFLAVVAAVVIADLLDD